MNRQHGTRAKYVIEKCRCEPCTAANREYARGRDRATRRPDEAAISPLISAVPLRAHLLELSDAGVGYKRVAEVAGVARNSLANVLNGKAKRVRRETADRALAVTPSAAADGAYIDAAPSWEFIRKLLAAGWTKVRISAAIGQAGRALQLGDAQITAKHARAIAELAARALPDNTKNYGARARAATTEFEELYTTLAEILEERQDPWRRQAACNRPGIGPDLFYVGRGESNVAAFALCNSCPVKAECAEAGQRARDGVWGGLSPKQRRRRPLEEVA